MKDLGGSISESLGERIWEGSGREDLLKALGAWMFLKDLGGSMLESLGVRMCEGSGRDDVLKDLVEGIC